MLNAKRLDRVIRSTEEEITKSAKLVPPWILWLTLGASIMILIVEFWPR